VKVFNLVTPSASDSWNCLSEIEGQELMAQLFCDVIIKNTGNGQGDHFWDNAELNLLKALVLYVERGYPEDKRNIGEVYQLLAQSSEKELNALFDVLPISHPAKAPYNIFKQSSESVRGGVIIGLGSRLQVFQNQDIRNITGFDEIDLELPGKQPCAYYCITSDQDSTFDFLSSLFLSFIFIKLVRYADQNCPGGALPVPVHVLGEELCACGVIPDLSRKISVIRSRNISMSCVFQNLAGLQNRYPLNQWQEILGNCDITLFLGCTDALTAQFISDRTGETSIAVTSKAKQLGTWRISNYTPEYRETSGVGKRKLMTMDEVLRMDVDRALVILRGRNVLEVDKYDYVQPGKTIEIEWENTPITGQIQVMKYAAEYNEVTGTPAGTPLQGAVYEISDPRSNKVVDYITTDARGIAASKPLPLGRYKIVEVTAPAYWQLSKTVFDETLEYSGQIIKVSDYDKPAGLGVVITKRGNAEVLAGNQMRYDFTVANSSNVALENFYWHDRIPTDVARAMVISTGTYSARLNYRILYKTNYSSTYQVLASNLITTSPYSFSLSAIPMQAGEYVTDVYFDFGKVPVGFQSTSNPTLTVAVNGTAANGYQLVNRADAGGKYQGTWQTAQATWVTVIRKLTPTVTPKLPKTGY
ncbi:MAG: type IV secretory system conjugative DNA transfer family protein, partial [Oscillospiraceae bacterium]|nr:type IV secretory system conjugative DNA transfer family protein [Oscillospiraceae bacterium]